MDSYQEMKSNINNGIYSHVVKPICFRCDPEKTHNFFLALGKMIENSSISRAIIRKSFHYSNAALEQNIKGIRFSNPIGLSAGFDKNAELIPIIGDVGFGFTEVGSITARPCPGNDGKRLMRLPDRKSLWVNFGLNNDGADLISRKLALHDFDIPVGVSIAKTNCKETVNPRAAIDDYVYSLKKFNDLSVGDYFTINISCPNAYGGQPFSDPKLYLSLMKKISSLNISKPILVKLSPDLDRKSLDALIEISRKYGVSGFICSNLTKKNIGFEKGGLSGKVVSPKADKLLSYMYLNTRDWEKAPILVGVGGIFSAEDAHRKIKLGANLVQMITGMIYNGPGVIGDINRELVHLLKEDGFSHISEAVGAAHSIRRKGGKK